MRGCEKREKREKRENMLLTCSLKTALHRFQNRSNQMIFSLKITASNCKTLGLKLQTSNSGSSHASHVSHISHLLVFYEGADGFAFHDATEIAGCGDVKDDDGEIVFLAEGKGGHVHDGQAIADDF